MVLAAPTTLAAGPSVAAGASLEQPLAVGLAIAFQQLLAGGDLHGQVQIQGGRPGDVVDPLIDQYLFEFEAVTQGTQYAQRC